MLAPTNKIPKLPLGPLPGLTLPAKPVAATVQKIVDQLHLGGKPFEQQSRAEQQQTVADAFNRRDELNNRIVGIEAGTGGIGLDSLEGLYKERQQLDRNIERYRQSQPDMVTLEEQKHTTIGRIETFVGGIGNTVKDILAYPLNHPVKIGPDSDPMFE